MVVGVLCGAVEHGHEESGDAGGKDAHAGGGWWEVEFCGELLGDELRGVVEPAAMIGPGVGIDYALFIVTRFRESVHRGDGVHAAIAEAMDTAGRAVLLAGLTVIVAVLGMVSLGVGFLSGLAVSSAIGVSTMMLPSLMLLRALLWGLGGSRTADLRV